MSSPVSNVDSVGVPVDHDGERLEDSSFDVRGFPGFAIPDTVMRDLVGANPSFQNDFVHGESIPGFDNQSPLSAQVASDEEEMGTNISVDSEEDLSPGAVAAAAARASSTSTIFRAALQINANEREAAISATKRVNDLHSFILSKGFTFDDVSKSLSLMNKGFVEPAPSRDEFGLPLLKKPATPCVDPCSVSEPNSVIPVRSTMDATIKQPASSAPTKASWLNIVKNSVSPAPSEIVFDYHPLKSGTAIVDPPMEILQKGIDKFKCCVVGTFSKGSLPFHKVADFAQQNWESKGLLNMSQKNNCEFLFKFASEAAMNIVLARGTWYIGSKPMIVRPWSDSSVVNAVKSLPLWVKLSQVPDLYWTREGLSFIASVIGKPIGADQLTSKLNPLQFAKMCVMYKAGDPLPDSITVNCVDPNSGERFTSEVGVSYPFKPLSCTGCSSLGHAVSACPITKRIWVPKSKADSAIPSEDVQPTTTVDNVVTPKAAMERSSKTVVEEEPWTVVNKKGKAQAVGPSPGELSDLSPPLPENFKSLLCVDEVASKHLAGLNKPSAQSSSNSKKRKQKRSSGKTPQPPLT